MAAPRQSVHAMQEKSNATGYDGMSV